MEVNLNKIVCLECQKDFNSEASLHKHLKGHKITQVAYYQKHYPRYDKFDGQIIRFKNKEYYFTTDFNSRANLKSWLQKVTPDEAKAYFTDYFTRRKARKGLLYTPSQCELRTLPVAGIQYLSSLFGDYYQWCASMGFKNKYSATRFSGKQKSILNKRIIIDTREQRPLKFKLRTTSEALPFGDYKLQDDEVTCNCYIERKSISDFYGTLSGGLERFTKEIERAKEAKANLIVVVEATIEEIYAFPTSPYVYGKVKISPEFIWHNMRKLIQDFPFIQFLFVRGRQEASRVIEKIFASRCEYETIDLQYAYDTGNL